VEEVEVGELLAAEANMIGLPVILAIDSAAPPRASPSSLVSTTPSKPTPSRNASGGVHRVLADHRVDDEQDLVGVDRVADVGGLRISSSSMPRRPAVSTMTTSCRVRLASSMEPAGDGDRVARSGADAALPGSGAKTGHAGPLTVDLQAGSRRWGAAGRHATSSGVLPWLLEPEREFAGQCGLAGALQAGEHDHRRRGLGESQSPGLATEDLDEFLVDDLDDLLGRVQRLGDLFALGRAP
jgi:hypothetical protein